MLKRLFHKLFIVFFWIAWLVGVGFYLYMIYIKFFGE